MDQTKKKKKKKPLPTKPKIEHSDKHIVYIYNKKTKKWQVYNPSGSVAYNCLSRDEWGWLD